MAQLVARLDDTLMSEVDQLITDGVVESRSDAVRVALRQFIERRQRAEIGQAIFNEYTARPQTAAEVGWSDASTLAMIAAEPW
jgi:metal-responsive CopG/Arc/MetJ family transcriptional regulator